MKNHICYLSSSLKAHFGDVELFREQLAKLLGINTIVIGSFGWLIFHKVN